MLNSASGISCHIGAYSRGKHHIDYGLYLRFDGIATFVFMCHNFRYCRLSLYMKKLPRLFWFFTIIPILIVDFRVVVFGEYITRAILVMLSWFVWATVHYFRAITEERHFMQDPDYQEYAKKGCWRFIPYVI